MLKFLTKYKQYMLVVFSALLMVAFIVPQANMLVGGSPEKRKVATVNGSKVTAEEMDHAIREYEALKALLEPLQLGRNMNVPEQYFGVKDAKHWYLMTRAAKEAGFMATAADGEEFERDLREGLIRTYSMQIAVSEAFRKMGVPGSMLTREFLERYAGMVMQTPEQQKQIEDETNTYISRIMPRVLGAAASGGRLNQSQLLEVFAKANSVGRLQTTWREVSRVSDKRTIATADKSGELVYVDHMLMMGSQLVAQAAEPSADTLKKLFDAHREQFKGSGTHGFGYRLPQRVKLEWMKIDRAAIGAMIAIDPIDANKHYRQNPQTFPKPFSEERSRVEEDMRRVKVDAIVLAIDKAFRAEALRLMGKVDKKDGLVVLPADWSTRMPRLEQLAQLVVEDVKAAAGATIPLPTVVVKGDKFLTENELQALPEIGASRLRVGSREIGLPEFVFKVRELSNDKDFALQTGVVYTEGFAEDAAGNRYYLTVLESRKDEPPQSIDEVREQVVVDAKTVEQFAAVAASAEQFRIVAANEGLEAASRLFTDTFPGADAPLIRRKLEVSSRSIRAGDPTFDRPEYRNAVLKAARALDINKMVIDQPADPRTLTVVLDDSLSVAIVQLVGRAPLTVERLRSQGDALATVTANEDFKVDDLRNAFSYAALKERFKFVDLSRGSEETENEEAKPAATAPAAAPKGS
ncbi:MAG: SurA N-terminal domain-containing protein [Phycisphaerales bacterium]|nr:SurA N-terminal domain-containing protein [Phycisphaerales bacterium]